MPKDVRQAFVDLAATQGQMTAESAAQWVADLEKQGRYQTETWA
jgi:sulfite reductase alpha subunit-like flavoprotein